MNETNFTRSKIGKRAGAVGFFCNLFLALGKIVAGSVFSSVSVLADGVNNLSDAASSGVTLLGFHFSKKPADKKHPYGHARYEYLSALVISAMILVAGFEVAKSAVGQILHPVRVSLTPLFAVLLCISIATKLFLVFFYSALEKKIRSDTLLAAKIDSRNDVLCTGAVLISVGVEHFFHIPIDGITSAALSLFILYSGIHLAKKTISPLLGEDGDPELKKKITSHFEACKMVLGCHDLIIHDYGPDKRYASIHVEMDQTADPVESHRLLDRLERECLRKFGVHLVTHLDPVEKDDPETAKMKVKIDTLLKMKDPRLEIHDLRFEKSKNEIFFDVTVPENSTLCKNELEKTMENAMHSLDDNRYIFHITLHL